MAEPIRVFPFLYRDVVVSDEAFVVLVIEPLFKRKKRLLSRVAHIERHYAGAAFLCLETQEAGRRAEVKYGLVCNIDATDIIVKPAAEIPQAADDPPLGQLHRVVEEAVSEIFNMAGLGQHHSRFLGMTQSIFLFVTLWIELRFGEKTIRVTRVHTKIISAFPEGFGTTTVSVRAELPLRLLDQEKAIWVDRVTLPHDCPRKAKRRAGYS